MKRFIVVTGLPASGKSTLGHAVAQALGLAFLDKDGILEALFESLGTGDSDWRLRLSRAADRVLQRQAMRSHGAVLASWWKHPRSPFASGTSPLWLQALPGQLIELHCRCKAEVAVQRFFARHRHAGHLDDSRSEHEELLKFREAADWGALGAGRLVEVNTEQPIELDALLDEIASL
ncbi:MAG TPA: AAA family ATPase [Thermoanaerobaculia bacterium]|jgi:hypothetical protein|nr:AAA family ATPase [Thermoanaerobaculia bacterium]